MTNFARAAGISTLYKAWAYLWCNHPYSQDLKDAIEIIRKLRNELIEERNHIQAS